MCREAASRSVGFADYIPGRAQSFDLAPVPLEFIEFLSMPKVKTHVAKSSYILASSADIKTERAPPPMFAPPLSYVVWFRLSTTLLKMMTLAMRWTTTVDWIWTIATEGEDCSIRLQARSRPRPA